MESPSYPLLFEEGEIIHHPLVAHALLLTFVHLVAPSDKPHKLLRKALQVVIADKNKKGFARPRNPAAYRTLAGCSLAMVRLGVPSMNRQALETKTPPCHLC